MRVHVHEPRREHLCVRIQLPPGLARHFSDAGDPPGFDRNIAQPGRSARAVHDLGVANDEVKHGSPPAPAGGAPILPALPPAGDADTLRTDTAVPGYVSTHRDAPPNEWMADAADGDLPRRRRRDERPCAPRRRVAAAVGRIPAATSGWRRRGMG